MSGKQAMQVTRWLVVVLTALGISSCATYRKATAVLHTKQGCIAETASIIGHLGMNYLERRSTREVVATAIERGGDGRSAQRRSAEARDLRADSKAQNDLQLAAWFHRVEDQLQAESPSRERLGVAEECQDRIDQLLSTTESGTYTSLAQLVEDVRGVGVGLTLRRQWNQPLRVVHVLRGSPAEKAGLERGDQVLSIARKSTKYMNLFRAGQLLDGAPGSILELEVAAAAGGPARAMEIKRPTLDEWIEIYAKNAPQTNLRRVTEDGLYIRGAGGKSHFDAAESMSSLGLGKGATIKSVVLDLRGAGLSTKAAAGMAALFLGENAVVAQVKFGQAPSKDYTITASPRWYLHHPDGPDPLRELPTSLRRAQMAVIVDSATYGAAEVLAAALSDAKRAKVYGERTAGKAWLVERVSTLAHGQLEVLAGWYLRANAAPINGEGVQPAAPFPSTDATAQVPDGEPDAIAREIFRLTRLAVQENEGSEATPLTASATRAGGDADWTTIPKRKSFKRPNCPNANDPSRSQYPHYLRTLGVGHVSVDLRFTVKPSGEVADPIVVQSTNPLFNAAAVDIIRSLKCLPQEEATRAEQPIVFILR